MGVDALEPCGVKRGSTGEGVLVLKTDDEGGRGGSGGDNDRGTEDGEANIVIVIGAMGDEERAKVSFDKIMVLPCKRGWVAANDGLVESG